MKMKYDIVVDDTIVQQEIKKITNQIFKLLPEREEGGDWVLPLQTLIVYLAGLNSLWETNQDILFPLLCKLEGLSTLKSENDFFLFRRTVFECLNIMNNLLITVKGELPNVK